MGNIISNSSLNAFIIPLQENEMILTEDQLVKQAGSNILRDQAWHSLTLQFISFKAGILTLRNRSGKRSYILTLQVSENNLLVNCNCAEINTNRLCTHAFNAVEELISRMGSTYFQKLRPGGLMQMAFTHKKYFNRKENLFGLDVEPRSGVKSVYGLSTVCDNQIACLRDWPGTPSKQQIHISDEALAYLIMVSSKNRQLPALLPCVGKLNKARSEIKTFYPFISGIQKEYSHLLTTNYKEMNYACHLLWKMVEKGPENILTIDNLSPDFYKITEIWNAWKSLLPSLSQHQYLYTYSLYWSEELKRKPEKRRLQPVCVSQNSPQLRFILRESTAFYRLDVQVWVNDQLLTDCDISTSLFIRHRQTLYLLSSVMDAVIAQWMHQSGGWTVFKVDFAAFDDKILQPLQQYYPIKRKTRRKSSNNNVFPT